MINSRYFKPSPWDSAAFGVNAYEILEPSRGALETALNVPGHYTVRIEPLASKKLLEEFNFYYCDTLIEPYCKVGNFTGFDDSLVGVSKDIHLDELLVICRGAFSYGRFNRDFNLPINLADQRYENWLKQLYKTGNVYELLYKGEIAGFIATENNRLVLHAISESLRGRGLAKYLWTPVCRALINNYCDELVSSISATNLAVLNLYSSLGFRFRNSRDIYHRLVL